MSRSISIWYTDNEGKNIDIETDYYDLFGTQQVSLKFWSLPILKEIGLKELTVLGYSDPIYFSNKEGMVILAKEISILEENKEKILFNEELIDKWIGNLKYCFEKLMKETPINCEPCLTIG